jgi:hypothetical protein
MTALLKPTTHGYITERKAMYSFREMRWERSCAAKSHAFM